MNNNDDFKIYDKADYYPAIGFHFKVTFDGFTKSGYDIQFQSVSGLQALIETEPVKAFFTK